MLFVLLNKGLLQMECVFDKCELWNGIGLGIISGLIASVMFAFLNRWVREYFYFKKKFGKLNGEYKGFGYSGENEDKVNNEPDSLATVRHAGENRLEISVTHNSLTWIGEITMNSLKYGLIVFQYKNESVKERFGFKRCIVEDDFKAIRVIGEGGYKKELFRKI